MSSLASFSSVHATCGHSNHGPWSRTAWHFWLFNIIRSPQSKGFCIDDGRNSQIFMAVLLHYTDYAYISKMISPLLFLTLFTAYSAYSSIFRWACVVVCARSSFDWIHIDRTERNKFSSLSLSLSLFLCYYVVPSLHHFLLFQSIMLLLLMTLGEFKCCLLERIWIKEYTIS